MRNSLRDGIQQSAMCIEHSADTFLLNSKQVTVSVNNDQLPINNSDIFCYFFIKVVPGWTLCILSCLIIFYHVFGGKPRFCVTGGEPGNEIKKQCLVLGKTNNVY